MRVTYENKPWALHLIWLIESGLLTFIFFKATAEEQWQWWALLAALYLLHAIAASKKGELRAFLRWHLPAFLLLQGGLLLYGILFVLVFPMTPWFQEAAQAEFVGGFVVIMVALIGMIWLAPVGTFVVASLTRKWLPGHPPPTRATRDALLMQTPWILAYVFASLSYRASINLALQQLPPPPPPVVTVHGAADAPQAHWVMRVAGNWEGARGKTISLYSCPCGTVGLDHCRLLKQSEPDADLTISFDICRVKHEIASGKTAFYIHYDMPAEPSIWIPIRLLSMEDFPRFPGLRPPSLSMCETNRSNETGGLAPYDAGWVLQIDQNASEKATATLERCDPEAMKVKDRAKIRSTCQTIENAIPVRVDKGKRQVWRVFFGVAAQYEGRPYRFRPQQRYYLHIQWTEPIQSMRGLGDAIIHDDYYPLRLEDEKG